MPKLRRIALVLAPLTLAILSAARPGDAQQTLSGRYAFADTTLLRDTLGLSFDGLFPLADSLGTTPDTLRALSIRYRYPLPRLVSLADSLGVPVDSVGPILFRERFNPLAAGARNQTDFAYNSTYSVNQANSSWFNAVDFNMVSGRFFVRNNTSVASERYRAGGQTSGRVGRNSVTELGWRSSPYLSFGGRANLDGFASGVRGDPDPDREDKNELQLSMRSQPIRRPNIRADLNVFGGRLDLQSFQQVKQGFSGDVNGRIRVSRGSWLTHDANGQLTGNLARTRAATSSVNLRTKDYSVNLRGTLGMWQTSPASFNLNYQIRNVQVETPTADSIQQVKTTTNGFDMSLRLRRDNERYFSVTRRQGYNRQANVQNLSSQNTRRDGGWAMTGRWAYRAFTLDGNFTLTDGRTEYPRRGPAGGYGEDLFNRNIDGTLTWVVTRRLNIRANGAVSLASYRYDVIGSYPTPPVDRESYRQSYRIEGTYTPNQKFNTGLGVEVSRTLSLNLPSESVGANNELRNYRANWRWSYRLSRGLTATQRNQISADYTFYQNPAQAVNNRAGYDFTTLTTLNAVVSQRLTLDLNHTARYQPGGNYVYFPDGLEYLVPADENVVYSLGVRLSYAPSPGISLNVQPEYYANDRSAASEGELKPTRTNRTLNLSAGTSLNLPLGPKGRLTGDIRRTYRGDQSTQYQLGVARPQPTTELDYWNGSLQLSWNL
jgi:hypothetical protein